MTITGAQLVTEAEKLGSAALGYRFGGTGPQYYDCSGLVQAALTSLGVKDVPRTSEQQYAWATPIASSQLAPGDLVFAQFTGDGASPGHVGIYVGGNQVYSAQDVASGIGLASLTSWKGSIVGFGAPPGVTFSGPTVQGVQGNVPGVSAPGSSPSGSTTTSTTTTGGTGTITGTGPDPNAPGGIIGFAAGLPVIGGLVKAIEPLLHAVATVIDYSFAVFEPGQGPRALFALAAAVLAFLAFKVLASSGTTSDVKAPVEMPV